MLKADLHIHTTASHDALNKPEEVFQKAKQAGLSAISFNDHDCMGHHNIGRELSQKYGISFLLAIEMSASWKEHNVDVHGFFSDQPDPSLEIFLRTRTAEGVRKTGHRLIGKLMQKGFDVSISEYDEIYDQVGGLGSPVVTLLTKKRYIHNIEEYIEKIGPIVAAEAVSFSPKVPEVIGQIHKAGGVAVFAHPGGSEKSNVIRLFETDLEELLDAGLDGVEVYHRWHDSEKQNFYLEFANRHNLIVTGGSDNHGKEKDHPIGAYYCDWQKFSSHIELRPKTEKPT